MSLYWGADLLVLYNDAWGELFGTRHPKALGRPAREALSPHWTVLGPLCREVLSGRGSLQTQNQWLALERQGRLENAWFDHCLTPIPREDGSIGGILQLTRETTERVRREQSLRESEACFHALTDCGPDATLVFADERVVHANFAAARLLRAGAPSALLARSVLDLIEAEHHGQIRNCSDPPPSLPGEAVLQDLRMRALDGTLLEVESAARATTWHGRQAVHVVLRDITARKRHEANLALLSGISRDFARLSCPEEILHAVAEKLGTHLKIRHCSFAEVDGQRATLTFHEGWQAADSPRLQGTYSLADCLGEDLQQASREGESIVIRDTQTDPRAPAQVCALHGIRAFVTVPLHSHGSWKYLLCVTDSRPRDWRDDEIALLQEVMNRLFSRVERARAEAALRDSETRYRTLFDSMDEGFCIVQVILDAAQRPIDLRYVETNPAFEQQSGLRNVLDKTVLELMPDLRPFWIDVFGRVGITGEPTRFVERLEPIGRWFDLYAFRIGEPHEHLVAILFSDITARRRAEEALRESEARHAFLVRLGDTLREMLDPAEVQSAAARLLGEHLGVARAYYYEYDEEAGCGVVHRDYVRDGGASLAGVYRFEDFSSSHRQLREGRPLVIPDMAGTPLLMPAERAHYQALGLHAHLCVSLVKEGRLLAVLAVSESSAREWTPLEISLVQDTAERTWAAVGRARAEAALRAADLRKDEFLATLAHELRNPLAPVRTGLRILRLSPAGGEAASKSLDMMERQVTHMVHLIDDLLDVSRISRGKIELKRERLTLRSVLDSAIEATRPFIDLGRHELTLTMRHEPLHLDADPTRLAQVIGNLINNAAKYTPDGGRIDLASAREGDEAVIRVKDNGIGIPPEMLPRVFEMFTQAGAACPRGQGGLGIGLAISKRLVEMHQGTIQADSAGTGLGAVFTVRLPLAPIPPGAARAGGASADAARNPSRRVLVVDDNADAAESLALMLELLGHESRTACNGLEALSTAREAGPSIVFCDIGMPGMNGYEVARRFRDDPALARIPLVALTGWGSEEDRQRSLQAGFDFHLTKPVDIEAMQEALARYGTPESSELEPPR